MVCYLSHFPSCHRDSHATSRSAVANITPSHTAHFTHRVSFWLSLEGLELLEPFFAEQPPVTRRRCSPVKITVLGIIVTTRDRPCQRSTLSSQHSQVFPINFPKSTRRSKPSFSHRKIPQQIEGCRIAWAKQVS